MKLGKLVVLILEGASLELVEKWAKSGYLPNLNSLSRMGTSGVFNSLLVPYEPSCLLTTFTGKAPEEHGCFSYWHVHGENFGGEPKIFQSGDSKATFFWNWDIFKNVKVNIVNLFGTHPPQSLNGNLISYPLIPSLHTSYPRKLIYGLSQRGISYGHDVSALYKGTSKHEFFELLAKLEDSRVTACDFLMKQSGDVSIFNLTLLDRVSHFWWNEIEDGILSLEDTILYKAYRKIDQYLGEFASKLSENDNLLIFSEIGFGSLKKFVSINDILHEAGLLHYDCNHQIDYNRSTAIEAVQGSHGINLNLCARYRNGWIEENNRIAYCNEIIQALLEAKNLDTGGPLFCQVLLNDSCYPGSKSAPDLICIPDDERYLPMGDSYWANKVHRDLQTGWHRRQSIWVGRGPAFAMDVVRDANCYSILPTIASCLGISLQGKSESLTTNG